MVLTRLEYIELMVEAAARRLMSGEENVTIISDSREVTVTARWVNYHADIEIWGVTREEVSLASGQTRTDVNTGKVETAHGLPGCLFTGDRISGLSDNSLGWPSDSSGEKGSPRPVKKSRRPRKPTQKSSRNSRRTRRSNTA